MIQFYCRDIKSNPVLAENDSQHCVKVLRMREGQTLQVVDGMGHRYTCRLADAHHKHAMVEIIDCEDAPLPWLQDITIAVAPTKMLDRMEWLVEKMVEIGVNRIVPLRCTHSERKELKTERLEKIAISAMKQSLKAWLPEIWPMTDCCKAIAQIRADQKYIAYCSDAYQRIQLAQAYIPRKDIAVLIGPEGDFTKEEVEKAILAGYKPVTLGNNRLRTETAALYSCSLAHIIDDRLK